MIANNQREDDDNIVSSSSLSSTIADHCQYTKNCRKQQGSPLNISKRFANKGRLIISAAYFIGIVALTTSSCLKEVDGSSIKDHQSQLSSSLVSHKRHASNTSPQVPAAAAHIIRQPSSNSESSSSGSHLYQDDGLAMESLVERNRQPPVGGSAGAESGDGQQERSRHLNHHQRPQHHASLAASGSFAQSQTVARSLSKRADLQESASSASAAGSASKPAAARVQKERSTPTGAGAGGARGRGQTAWWSSDARSEAQDFADSPEVAAGEQPSSSSSAEDGSGGDSVEAPPPSLASTTTPTATAALQAPTYFNHHAQVVPTTTTNRGRTNSFKQQQSAAQTSAAAVTSGSHNHQRSFTPAQQHNHLQQQFQPATSASSSSSSSLFQAAQQLPSFASQLSGPDATPTFQQQPAAANNNNLHDHEPAPAFSQAAIVAPAASGSAQRLNNAADGDNAGEQQDSRQLFRPSSGNLVFSAPATQVSLQAPAAAAAAPTFSLSAAGVGEQQQQSAATQLVAAPSFEHVVTKGCPLKGVFSWENKDYCDRYYMCTNGTFTEEACPNGLAYSQMGAVYQHCAYNWNVNCGLKKAAEPLASPGCPWQFGIFPVTSAGRCSIDYFVCEWGVPETKRCSPEGLFYDDRIKGCQWADQLGCKSENLLNFKCPPEDEDNPYWPYPRYYHTKQDVIVCVNEQPRLVHCTEEQIVDPNSLACLDLNKKNKKKQQMM